MSLLSLTTGFAGEYNIVINKPDGTQIETGWFKNLITDIGLDRLAVDRPIVNARVGTGTSTPSVLNTALDAQIASSAAAANFSAVNSGAPNYTSTITQSFAFAQGAVVGNITEIGIGWATTGATLFSRALILDNLGFPISLTITAIDQLTVYYRLIVVPPLADITGTVNISSTPYNYTGRIGIVGSFFNDSNFFSSSGSFLALMNTNAALFSTYGAGATLGAITSSPTAPNSSNMNVSASYSTYTAGTYYRDTTANLTVLQGNVTGGIQALYVPLAGTSSRFQYRFDTPVPKDNTKTFSMTFRSSWNRV